MSGFEARQRVPRGEREGAVDLPADANHRKQALFNLSNRTLASTSSWSAQVKFQVLSAVLFVCYTTYWMDMSSEKKALSMFSYALAGYAAINLSGNVRNRVEAEKLEQYAKGTDLYGISNVKTLRGSEVRYYFHWVVFMASFVAMVYSIFMTEANSERRGHLLGSGLMFLNSVFIVVKALRDTEDADKWYRDYHGHDPEAQNGQ